jgi:hypothetical protein
MQPTDLDPSLAFTALLDLDPSYGKLDHVAAADERSALLDAWYHQVAIRNMHAFARQWLQGRDTGTERECAAYFRRLNGGKPAWSDPGFPQYRAGWRDGVRYAVHCDEHSGFAPGCPWCAAERLAGTHGEAAQAAERERQGITS